MTARISLKARLLQAAVAAVPVAAVAVYGACSTPGGGLTAQMCFNLPLGGTGGAGGGGTGGASGDAGPPTACPDQATADKQLGFFPGGCGSIISDGTIVGDQCCYIIGVCGTGRPYLEAGRPRSAQAERGGDPRAWRVEGGAPRVSALSPELRARLSQAWAADGLLEHASVASFGRFALELMAVGAPADVEVSAALADVAARAVREGCVGETLGSIQAAEQLARAEDPWVLDALAVLVEDEACHAELSWRFVAWAVARGGPPVRAAVAAAFADAVPLPEGDDLPEEMATHGRLGAPCLRAALGRALADVVRPCAERLLAA